MVYSKKYFLLTVLFHKRVFTYQNGINMLAKKIENKQVLLLTKTTLTEARSTPNMSGLLRVFIKQLL